VEANEFITLARVVKTQGRRGEVAAEVHSDIPDRFAPGMKLFALSDIGARRELEIEGLWAHGRLVVFKFVAIDSISDAEKLVGVELQVSCSQRAQLEPGWTYVSDLVGCTLLDHGCEVGRIDNVQFGAGEAPLLIIANVGNNFEIPFAEAYLESVDLSRKQVRMTLPEGMLEINAPMTEEEKRQQGSDLKGHGLKPRRQRQRSNRGL